MVMTTLTRKLTAIQSSLQPSPLIFLMKDKSIGAMHIMYIMRTNKLLSVPEFTANLNCICLSIDVQYI